MTPAAPADFGLEADRSLKRLDGGRLLVGGSPLRILRLSATGARLLAGWLAGEPVGGGRADQALARRLLDSGIVHPRPGPDPSVGLGSVTAVIPVRDDPAGLAETLAALGGSITAVVVDDASVGAPAIAEVARRFGARLLVRPVNGGPGAARNTGLAQVTNPIVVFVDADATIDPPALEVLLGHFSDPVVDAVAPRVRSRPGPGLLAAYEAEHSPLDMGGSPSAVGPQRRVHHVPAAVLSVRADTARRTGGFDESMRWGEDVDFVWRLARGGATVRYEPVAVAWHRPRATWRAWVDQRRRYGASAAVLAERHGTAVAPARCSRSAALAWAAAALGHPVLGLAVAASSAVRLAARLHPLADASVAESLRMAAQLTLRGHWTAGASLARATTRAWLPLAVGGAACSRRLRPAVLAAVLTPALLGWFRGRRPRGPAMSAGLQLADDVAYCAGLWQGMAARRATGAIRPSLVASTPSTSSLPREGNESRSPSDLAAARRRVALSTKALARAQ